MKRIFLILTVMATLVSCGGNSTDATAPATDAGTATEATTEATSDSTTSDSTSVEATSNVVNK